MRVARYFLPVVLVALTSCSKDEPSQPTKAALQTIPQDLGRLVPSDAVLVVYFSPLDQLEPKIKELVRQVDEAAVEGVDLNEIFEESGVDPTLVDRSRPLLVALTLEQGRPVPHFILPVTDSQKVSVEGAVASGDYVAIALGGTSAVGGSTPALAQDLPAGDIVMRADITRVVAQFRPMIEQLSAETIVPRDPMLPAQPEETAVLDSMIEAVKNFVLTTERLEGAVRFDGGKVDLSLSLTRTESGSTGESSGPRLRDLAASIDAANYPMLFLFSADWSAMMDSFMPMYDAMLKEGTEEERAKFRAYMEKSKELYEFVGPSMAMAFSLDAGGFEVVGAMQAKDAATYLARYRELIELDSMEAFGLEFRLEEPQEFEGTKLDRYRMKFDWEKLMKGTEMPEETPFNLEQFFESFFGKEGVRFAQGAVGDRIVMAMGQREGLYADAVKTAKARSGKLPASVQAALAEDTSFLVYMDLRRLIGGLADLWRKFMPEMKKSVPAGGPVELLLSGSSEGRTYRLAVHLDVGGVAQVIKAMK